MLRMVAHISVVNVLVIGLTAVTSPLIARLLGPSGRGELAVAMLWPTVIGAVALFGVDVTVGRLAARWPLAVAPLRLLSLRLSLLLGGAAMAAGALFIPWLLPASKEQLWGTSYVVLCHIPWAQFIILAAAVALSCGRLWGYNLPRLAFSATYLALIFALWALHIDEVRWVAGAFTLATILTTFLSWFMLRAPKTTPVETEQLEPPPTFKALQTFRASLGFGSAALLEAGSTHVPMALLSFLLPPAEIGFYAVSMTAASLQEAFGGAVGKALFTHVAASSSGEGTVVSTRLRYTVLLYLVLAMGMMVVLPPLMPWVFGAEFAASQRIVLGLIPAASVLSVGRVYNETLKGAGQAKPAMVARFVGPLVLIVVAFILVPRIGIMGMVAAVAGGAFTQVVLFVHATARHFQVPIHQVWAIRPQDVRDVLRTARALWLRAVR